MHINPVRRAGAQDRGTPTYHHFTVDVEEHFQVTALEPYVPRPDWDRLPSRVAGSTRRLLDLLARHDARGTFFVLGWVAQRCPSLVRDIAAAGHEVASHGTDHRRVTQLDPHAFRASVRDSKQILEHITGTAVAGYRAPSFSIPAGHEWALDILLEEGYVYDSSLYPVRRSGYGYAGGIRHPHALRRPGGTLLEYPPATLSAFGRSWPAGGGAYLRLLPFALVHSALAQAAARGHAATLYIHPWEVDPDQPRHGVDVRTRIRHYGGLRRTLPRLDRLLQRFAFRPIIDDVAAGTPLPAGAPT